MTEQMPTTSTPSALTQSQSAANDNQPLRWSLQNFPVPVQLQARIPRSPLSVARELLPNFPSQLAPSAEVQQLPQTSQMSLQQQLQQQFQRQLNLNLQGGGESDGSPLLPDPPDTILELGQGQSLSGESVPSNSSNNSALRSGTSSSGLLETLLRSAQAASAQRGAHSRDSAGVQGSPGSSLTSRSQGLGAHNAHSNNHNGQYHRHPHSNSHGFHIVGDGSGEGTSTTELSGLVNHTASGGTPAIAAAAASAQTPSDNNAAGQPPAELSLLYKWLLESGVFVFLLLLHFLYDHRLGLLVFLCMGGTFYYTNMKLVHAIHQSAVRKQVLSWLGALNLAWLSGFLLLNVVILYYVFSEQQLWKLLFFQMAAVTEVNVWTLLWLVVMTDYVAKFLTIIAKAVVAMMQPCCRNYRRRGKYFLLIEAVSQLYRQLVTVVPWLYYLNDSTRTSVWFALLTEGVYLCFKSWSVWSGVKLLYSAMLRFSTNTNFGTKPSAADLAERGNQCPICQDVVNEPVMLACKHIFCEMCVSIWFDREKTCPMCRAQITSESPAWRDGNTSAHLQWH